MLQTLQYWKDHFVRGGQEKFGRISGIYLGGESIKGRKAPY